MKKWKPLAASALMLLLLQRPAAALEGARAAMAQWYWSAAPALFPFMALMPMITCPESRQAFERLLGGLTRRIFRLPGTAAPAILVGMLAGAPAGALAVRQVAPALSRDQMKVLATSCCGLSPAFLIGGVGAALLNDPAGGRMLLRSQVISQLILLLRARRCADQATYSNGIEEGESPTPLFAAVKAILTVAGWMTLFGALAGVARTLSGRLAGDGLLCLMEVTSGAKVIAGLRCDQQTRLVLMSALMGWGGVCVGIQHLSALGDGHISIKTYFFWRAAAAMLGACATFVQMKRPLPAPAILSNPLPFALFCACALLIPALCRLKRTVS